MTFQVRISENGSKNKFREKQRTNKVSLMSLDVKVVKEKQKLIFRTTYLALENLKINSKKSHR